MAEGGAHHTNIHTDYASSTKHVRVIAEVAGVKKKGLFSKQPNVPVEWNVADNNLTATVNLKDGTIYRMTVHVRDDYPIQRDGSNCVVKKKGILLFNLKRTAAKPK